MVRPVSNFLWLDNFTLRLSGEAVVAGSVSGWSLVLIHGSVTICRRNSAFLTACALLTMTTSSLVLPMSSFPGG